MLDEVKRKVTLDLLFSPYSLVPALLGITALMGTWANDGPAWLGLAGLCGVMIGLGILATRFLLQLDSLMKKAWDSLRAQEKKKRDDEILQLHDKLAGDRDKRATGALSELVSAYAAFCRNINQENISVPQKSVVIEKVNLLFAGCLKQLERSHELCLQIRQLTGSAKDLVVGQRNKVIEDVTASIAQMSGTLEQCVSLVGNNEGSLSDLRKELESTMRVAVRTNERMTEMGLNGNRER
jgi:hypothetical protein